MPNIKVVFFRHKMRCHIAIMRRGIMGRIIKPDAIKNMTADMKQNWLTLEIKLYAILDYLNSLIASEEFKGKTAEAFKMQM